MGCLKLILTAVRRLDMFPTGELLRYKGQPVYRTITGGFISLVILIIFAVLFASTAMETLNKEIITSTLRAERQADPTPSDVTFSPSNGMMLALAITGSRGQLLNLSDTTTKVFDVRLMHYKKHSDRSVSYSQVPLVSCTQEHFTQSESTRRFYIQGLTQNLLCPQINKTVNISGSRVSTEQQWMALAVSRCDSQIYSNCISDQDLESLQTEFGGNFRPFVTLMGNNINPQSAEYKEPFLDGRYEMSFTTVEGIELDMYITQSIVKTDDSISPLSDIIEDKILSIEEFLITRQVSTASNVFMQVAFQKSAIQRTYERSFQKVDKFFSYVGGLIGTIIGILFLLTFYSRQAYSISIAAQLYLSEEGNKISSRAFHLGYFFMIPLKRLINLVSCCSLKWDRTDFYTRCMDEANQQLDVFNMMKKITFLEKAISMLFTKSQLEALYLFEKERIDEVESKRKKHELGKKLNGQTNKVTPEESPSDLQSESNDPNVNELIANPHHILKTDEELSVGSVSQVNPLSQKRIKTHLKTLMKQSREGNNISSQITSSINPRLLASMGLRKEDPIIQNSQSSSGRSCSIRHVSKVRFGPSEVFESEEGEQYRGQEIVSYSRGSDLHEEKSK